MSVLPALMRTLLLLALGAPVALGAQSAREAAAQARAARDTAQEGLASFYARRRQGRRTASGERFDNAALVAAHPSLPFGTRLRVTNLGNGRSVEVRVVDRGPSVSRQRAGYIIDLSRAAAIALDVVSEGHARVRLDVIGRARDEKK